MHVCNENADNYLTNVLNLCNIIYCTPFPRSHHDIYSQVKQLLEM